MLARIGHSGESDARPGAAGARPGALPAGTRQHRVNVTIGVAVYPEGGRTADELLGNGPLPLDVLEAHMKEWVGKGKKSGKVEHRIPVLGQ